MTQSFDQRANRDRRYAMTVDVEDYFQVWAFSDVVKREHWDGYPPRAEAATHRVLDLFDRRGVKATFFMLGWVAERAPALAREIVTRGHELASHGYDHKKVFDQTADEFRADVAKSKRILEDLSGRAIRGFRAAGFSIDQRTPWAHAVLAETGHAYSSSSHPIAHDHYGDPKAPRDAHVIDGVIEAPVATSEVLGTRVSCAGGGWFRVTPYPLSRRLLQRAGAAPTVFYFHPWEIDADQPRIEAASARSKFRHYLNIAGMEAKLDRLLGDFLWERLDEALGLRAAKEEAA